MVLNNFKEILADLVPLIRSWGFKGSGQNYRKVTEHAVCVINFQKSTGGAEFYINLGMRPLVLPLDSTGRVTKKNIKEHQCMFRKRVPPPEGTFRWPYAMDAATVDLLKSRLTDCYKSYLTELATIPGPLTEVTVDDFSDDDHPLFGRRHSMTFLDLSKIAFAYDQCSKGLQFLEAAIAHCPPAASGLLRRLKAELKDVSA